jgi:hypothetical protein
MRWNRSLSIPKLTPNDYRARVRAAQNALNASRRKPLTARAGNPDIILEMCAVRCAVLGIRHAVS